MRSALAPPDTFWLQKAIDGMPGVNGSGSTQLAGMRLSKFLHPEVFGQQLYESLPNAEEFKHQLLASGSLLTVHIPLSLSIISLSCSRFLSRRTRRPEA